MDFIEFPKWKYKGPATTGVLVEDAAAERKLGKGWKDAPTEDVPAVEPEPEAPAEQPLV